MTARTPSLARIAAVAPSLSRRVFVAAIAATLAAIGPARAAGPPTRLELSGDWGVLIVQPATGCEWTGVMRLREQGGRITGDGVAEAPLLPGRAPRCPRLEGKVQGDRQGENVRFGFATGRLGQADFQGRVGKGAGEMTGTWRTRSASGEWSAAR